MHITDFTMNTKIKTYLQSLWNQKQKLTLLTIDNKKRNLQKPYIKPKYKLVY